MTISANHLVEAHCLGIGRAGQLLSNHFAVEADWNVKLFSTMKVFISCKAMIAQQLPGPIICAGTFYSTTLDHPAAMYTYVP